MVRFPCVRPPFGPRNRRVEDFPIIEVDVLEDEHYYLKRLEIMGKREKDISPFDIEGVHATPLSNHEDDTSSFHILRLNYPHEPTNRVDLLIRDQDLYFVAFRVEEDKVWGGWFCFRDMIAEMPDFLNATRIEMDSSYNQSNKCKPGGDEDSMQNIFKSFVRYNLVRRVTTMFVRSVFAVMNLYCEARRLRSMRILMCQRIAARSAPEELPSLHWKRMHTWSTFGTEVLKAYRKNRLTLAAALPRSCRLNLELETFGDLIGVEGELLIIKLNKKDFELTEQQFALMKRAAGNIPNVEFVVPPPPEGEDPQEA